MEPPVEPPFAPEWRYWAFISYSHRDRRWADWLHAQLETYRIPKRLVGTAGRDAPVPVRVFPVFRDREELAGAASLGDEIEQALRQSRSLIVICSPDAAASRCAGWVRRSGPSRRWGATRVC